MSLQVRTGLVAIVLAATCFTPGAANDDADMRVGVVAFEDFAEEIREWQEIFAGFPQAPSARVRIAAGTYGDLLHWMRQGWIDVGILTPGVFAEALRDGLVATPSREGPFAYVATVGLPPAGSAWAGDDRRAAGRHFGYRSICVVPADSPLRTVEDLRQRAAGLELVFVHPLSVSGRILPETVLRRAGIVPAPQRVRFSHSHSASLRLLAGERESAERMAFVWDDALRAVPELADRLRRIELPELDGQEIPHDVVVVRRGFAGAERLSQFLERHADAHGSADFLRLADWEARYGAVGERLVELRLSALSDEGRAVTLDEIGQMLLHAARSRPEPPRLALVFSGGGAKCSYQVGAVAAVEQKLAELRQQQGGGALDVALVIGTSGGAMNALPVALGIASTEEGREAFAATWRALDQRRMVRPSAAFRANIGAWFALLVAAIVLFAVRKLIRRPERRGLWIASMLLAAGLATLVLGAFDRAPWDWLGDNHVWHHAWLWMSFGRQAFAWSLVALGLVGLIVRKLAPRKEARERQLGWPIVAGLALLPLVQLITVLLFQTTLSSGTGLEHVLAGRYPALIDGHLVRGGEPRLAIASTARAGERLRQASREIAGRGLVRRDLVITGNCIEQSAGTLPSDLYFYLPGDSGMAPPAGAQWISLERHPAQLLDVVMGSGAIFPMFPSRTLADFPEPGERVELVDGGFAHNSPIEAAVLWGATHVLLIEASPEERKPRRNFLENSSAAFAHLYKQAQLLDARSKSQVVVFTLAPEPPHVCVLDFASNLIGASIERGYRDALGADGLPRFRKEPSEPRFADPPQLADTSPHGSTAWAR